MTRPESPKLWSRLRIFVPEWYHQTRLDHAILSDCSRQWGSCPPGLICNIIIDADVDSSHPGAFTNWYSQSLMEILYGVPSGAGVAFFGSREWQLELWHIAVWVRNFKWYHTINFLFWYNQNIILIELRFVIAFKNNVSLGPYLILMDCWSWHISLLCIRTLDNLFAVTTPRGKLRQRFLEGWFGYCPDSACWWIRFTRLGLTEWIPVLTQFLGNFSSRITRSNRTFLLVFRTIASV